ncbi:hypothetical protein ISS37_01665 [candidate division KSB1 bacterium]|nr:hypothetical protein [candidate division KSB1 bacterium]
MFKILVSSFFIIMDVVAGFIPAVSQADLWHNLEIIDFPSEDLACSARAKTYPEASG